MVRHIIERVLKLSERRTVTSVELLVPYFYRRAGPGDIGLFITPQTKSLLKRLEHLPHYAVLICRFSRATKVSRPARYFKRWARWSREYGFTKEDADVLGRHVVVTFDQLMMNQWSAQASFQLGLT